MTGFTNVANKPFPTYSDVLKHITDQQIFQSYIPNIKFNQPMRSPLGERDDNPSFSVFWSFKYQKYLFKEHRYGWFGDCFDFVQRLYGFTSNTDALMQVCLDFGLDQYYIKGYLKKGVVNIPPKLKVQNKRRAGKCNIRFTVRKWQDYDIEYWKQYGITKQWLDIAGIYPIKYFFINSATVIADKHAYVYVENKDGVKTYKIYQPYSEINKWTSNNNNSVWELWSMMPPSHDILVITKSRKDALSIMSTCNIPSISLQAEGTIPKKHIISELKQRFKNIYLLYDNDFDKTKNYGRDYGRRLSDLFDIPQIELPEKYESKDFSDLVKAKDSKFAKSILFHIIREQNKNE